MTNTIEKTITPDKVTEMYDAVKKEVKSSILRAYTIDTDELHGVVLEYRPDEHTMSKEVVTRFLLNNKEYVVTKTIKRYENEGLSDTELLDIFFDNYVKELANQIMKPMLFKLLQLSKT